MSRHQEGPNGAGVGAEADAGGAGLRTLIAGAGVGAPDGGRGGRPLVALGPWNLARPRRPLPRLQQQQLPRPTRTLAGADSDGRQSAADAAGAGAID